MIVAPLPIKEIEVDPSLQPRVAGLDPAHVATLEAVPDSWRPVAVVRRGASYLLVDGFHRLAAAMNLDLLAIDAIILDEPEDGDLHGLAFALNAVHGKPLSLTDRRVFAERLLRQSPSISNLEVSRRSGLSPTTIAGIRERLEGDQEIDPVEQRVSRSGYSYTPPQGTAERPVGELPKAGFGESVGEFFSSAERKQQRRIVSYLQRLAVALEDQDALDGWGTGEDAAEACRLVLGDDRAATLADRLGAGTVSVLAVAEALGFDGTPE